MADVRTADVRTAGDGLRVRLTITEADDDTPHDLVDATFVASLGNARGVASGAVTVEDEAGGVILVEWPTGMIEPVSTAQVRVTQGGLTQTVWSKPYVVQTRLG